MYKTDDETLSTFIWPPEHRPEEDQKFGTNYMKKVETVKK